jgi:hypothetical protein
MMMSKPTNRVPQRASLGVEELESRQLLSVAMLPRHINLKTANHSHAVLTVAIRTDSDPATAGLLQSPPSSLTVSIVDSSGHSTSLGSPRAIHSENGNGGVSDLFLQLNRSTLAGLAAGTYQLQVSDGNPADTETATFVLFQPGHGH